MTHLHNPQGDHTYSSFTYASRFDPSPSPSPKRRGEQNLERVENPAPPSLQGKGAGGLGQTY
ncbi:MAG: hypothetical protein KME25_32170 [Symplocastrum torsivum CPER-KK1]|uniref:Uncharacterized protein n=1 Tax=Symplocastrum torsivum CPER-KK1 TaxID=450513 RepID=A0A951PRP4_9CYAN|nr:hypothetical protein [Symplocastrum torsivum CPER-KK1]